MTTTDIEPGVTTADALHADPQPSGRLGWKIFFVVMLLLTGFGLAQPMRHDQWQWFDWTYAAISIAALAGLGGYAFRLAFGGPAWKLVALAEIAGTAMAIFVSLERAGGKMTTIVLVGAALTVLLAIPFVIALLRYAKPEETSAPALATVGVPDVEAVDYDDRGSTSAPLIEEATNHPLPPADGGR